MTWGRGLETNFFSMVIHPVPPLTAKKRYKAPTRSLPIKSAPIVINEMIAMRAGDPNAVISTALPFKNGRRIEEPIYKRIEARSVR